MTAIFVVILNTICAEHLKTHRIKESDGFGVMESICPPVIVNYIWKISPKTKKIETMAWMGFTGQDRYEMTIKLGLDSIKNYKKGLSLIDCLPSDESLDWVTLDIEKKQLNCN